MDDKQFTGNSLKVTVKGSSCDPSELNSSQEPVKQELYKRIPEDNLLPPVKKSDENNQESVSKAENDIKVSPPTVLKNGDSTMVQEDVTINDGADEQMLGNDDHEKLEPGRDEVKFIKGDQQNGDVKIDMGVSNGKTFTGMSKEELMKYANDPFWVRLRWIFFIAFWATWLAMLIGAILIIIQAPKCAAPEPLPWYKQGPLAKLKSVEAVDETDLKSVEKIHATGAIYELPAELTYSVKEPAVEQKIKDLVAKYTGSNVNVILDITPNYVGKHSRLMQQALSDRAKRSAFIWMEQPEVPNNWLSIVNGSAWSEVQPGNYVLSQFGDGLFDLHMNDTLVKNEFTEILTHLMRLGVKGFRLKNTKFFLLNKNFDNDVPSNDPRFIHTQYGFWTHLQTTFHEGLGDLLYEYLLAVKNFSSDALFSVAEDIIRPEVYHTKAGDMSIDLPIYGLLTRSLSSPQDKQVSSELQNTFNAVDPRTWMQWNFDDLSANSSVDPSAFSLFMSLLPGVPVVSVDSLAFTDKSNETYRHMEELRSMHSFKYGDFEMYQKDNGLAAYSRIKSGNPGYFVAFNPTNVTLAGNYTNLGLPDKMTVDAISDNYNVTDISEKTKVTTDSIEVSPYSTIILTYVPVKSG